MTVRDFVSNLPPTGEGCIPWPFARKPSGYGKIAAERGRGGRQTSAHRYVCEIFHGPPPTPEHVAAHTCGMGMQGCVAPYHLKWKTQKENADDRILHGTSNRGERHGNSRLSADDIAAIRAHPGRAVDIAHKFGIRHQYVYRIKSGRARQWG